MKENSTWRAVREGRATIGTGIKELASRDIPRIIAASGFDYCMIDRERGAFDLETIADLAGWFQATDMSAIVGIHKSFTYLIPAYSIRGSWAAGSRRSMTPRRYARSRERQNTRRSAIAVSRDRGCTPETSAHASVSISSLNVRHSRPTRAG